jgi:hypothetical protein
MAKFIETMNGVAVYHFTCTARLPWIVEAGELRPGRNQVGSYPVDFLWATTNKQGDRTASAMQRYRAGGEALVRLTLHAEDFEEWPAILERFPQWTREHVRRLENAARRRGETNFSSWHARAGALPLSRFINAEAKTYTGGWVSIDPQAVCLRGKADPTVRGTLLGGTVYVSAQRIEPGEPTAYATCKPLDEWARTAFVAEGV